LKHRFLGPSLVSTLASPSPRVPPPPSPPLSTKMWGAFDDVRCICLKERDDRYHEVSATFQAVGATVRFFRPERSPHGSAFGCYQSHYEIVKEAYESGAQNVLIFEDDVVFNDGWENILDDCARFVQSGEHWEALFLGSLLVYPVARSDSQPHKIVRAKVCNTHAYAISRAGMAVFLQHPPTLPSPHCDVFFWTIWDHAYAHVDSAVVVQNQSPTDNIKHAWLASEYRDWFEGIPRHRMWEAFSRNLFRLSMWLPSSARPNTAIVPDAKVLIDGNVTVLKSSALVTFCGFIPFLVGYAILNPPPGGLWKMLKYIPTAASSASNDVGAAPQGRAEPTKRPSNNFTAASQYRTRAG